MKLSKRIIYRFFIISGFLASCVLYVLSNNIPEYSKTLMNISYYVLIITSLLAVVFQKYNRE